MKENFKLAKDDEERDRGGDSADERASEDTDRETRRHSQPPRNWCKATAEEEMGQFCRGRSRRKEHGGFSYQRQQQLEPALESERGKTILQEEEDRCGLPSRSK